MIDELVDLAHRHALDAVEAQRLADHLQTSGGVVAARLEADASDAELDRLRGLPEVKVGQRVRHLAKTLRRRIDDPSPSPNDDHAPTGDGDTVPTSRPAVAAVIVVRNRRAGLAQLLDVLGASGIRHVELVDDGSADPATVELLATLPHPVHRVEPTLGPIGPWALGIMARLLASGPVLVSDGDTVPAEGCPDDVIDRLRHELERDPSADAVITAREDTSGDRQPAVSSTLTMVRQGLDRRPTTVVTLDAPYTTRSVSAQLEDDPAELFARRHDHTG